MLSDTTVSAGACALCAAILLSFETAASASTMQISAEEAQRVLKDLIFQTWAAADCESHADTLKTVRMVDLKQMHLHTCFTRGTHVLPSGPCLRSH